MEKYKKQIQRIKAKLIQAKSVDNQFRVFGASRHQYYLGDCVSISKVEKFESKYELSLPDCYKTFLLEIGNGGKSHDNSAAGPFYGIYPFGKREDDLVMSPENCLAFPVLISSGMTEEEWLVLSRKLEDDFFSEEDYERELEKNFGGVLPLGTQGCSYIHALILNGVEKGKVVNIELTGAFKPKFAFEDNFLDWYERWLDEVISEDLIKSDVGWFGYSKTGSEESLIKGYYSSKEHLKNDNLYGLLRKNKISQGTVDVILKEYPQARGERKRLLLQIACKCDYPIGKKLLLDESSLLEDVLKCIYWYAVNKAVDWVTFVEERTPSIRSEDELRFSIYIMEKAKVDYSTLILPFIENENASIRAIAYTYLGKSKHKMEFKAHFIKALKEERETEVIRACLQSCKEINELSFLVAYKSVLERFSKDEYYIHNNLKLRLQELGFTLEQFSKLPEKDLTVTVLEVNKKTGKKWYEF